MENKVSTRTLSAGIMKLGSLPMPSISQSITSETEIIYRCWLICSDLTQRRGSIYTLKQRGRMT